VSTPLKIFVYPIFAFVCLVLFSILLFPFESVKNRVSSELENSLDGVYSISIGDLSPSLPLGAVLKNVTIKPRGSSEVPVLLNKAKVKVALLPLLAGSMEVDFDVKADKGKAKGDYSWKKGWYGLHVTMDQFDLSLFRFFLQKSGVPLSGVANGSVALQIFTEDPLRNSGKMTLQFPDLTLGEIDLGAMKLPLLKLAQLGSVSKVDMSINRGNIEVNDFQFSGADLDFKTDGKIYGARKMDNYRFNLKGNLKIPKQTADKIPILGLIEKQKTPEGDYPFTITGRLTKPSIRIGEFKLPI